MADEREFDVILWGATGFTGQRVATKLAARSGDARWAIAGRNERKLREIADQLSRHNEIAFEGADRVFELRGGRLELRR